MLTYRKDLKDKSRTLRTKSTLSEVLLWNKLKRKQLNYQFLRQKPIGNYIVDFYCPEKKLVIEIDGVSHMNKYDYDIARVNYLNSMGLSVLVFSDLEVKKNINNVVQSILNKLEE